VDVQVHIADSGAGQFNVVGLADKAVAESRERVRAALSAIGLALPFNRITVNLAPADLPKEGSHYDLPIALGLLAAMGVLPASEMANYVALGELSLDAAITAVPGVLPAAIAANEQGRGLICPEACGAEAAFAGTMDILAAPSLIALVNHMKGASVLTPPVPKVALPSRVAPDLRDVKGQESAKCALEIAAAGGHNLLMIGPPGAGKSMLAQRLPGLLPPLDAREALEISLIQSLSGNLEGGAISRERPFRNPHHSASMAALVGGGLKVKPGEVSLAHLGVLFLDELPEFARAVLDSLRQPIESGEAVVARANAHVKYPARFQLVAAMNPCRCGYLSDPARGCGRAPNVRWITRRGSPARCSTASTCTWMLHPSRPPTCRCRRHPRAAGMWRCAWQRPAPASASGWHHIPCAPMPRWKARCWSIWRLPMTPGGAC
jgi:magnesium chelatase family protein